LAPRSIEKTANALKRLSCLSDTKICQKLTLVMSKQRIDAVGLLLVVDDLVACFNLPPEG
jgi:hypothetical protein